jgi:hypothetical protein
VPLRVNAGTAVEESSSGVDASSDSRHLTVNIDETEALVRRNEWADGSESPLPSVEEIFVEALRDEARYCTARGCCCLALATVAATVVPHSFVFFTVRSLQSSLEEPASSSPGTPPAEASHLPSDADPLPVAAQDYWFAYHLAKRYEAMKPSTVAASSNDH